MKGCDTPVERHVMVSGVQTSAHLWNKSEERLCACVLSSDSRISSQGKTCFS